MPSEADRELVDGSAAAPAVMDTDLSAETSPSMASVGILVDVLDA